MNHVFGRVLVAETTEIRGCHEAVVPGVVATKSQELAGPAIVEPLEGGGELATRGLALGRSLVEVGTEYVPLRVFNPGQETKTARKGQLQGLSPRLRQVPFNQAAWPEVPQVGLSNPST